MRSKLDARIEGKGRQGKARKRISKPKPLPGGKVLQRLFSYLAEREPGLTSDVVAHDAGRPKPRDRGLRSRQKRCGPSRSLPPPWPSRGGVRRRRSHSRPAIAQGRDRADHGGKQGPPAAPLAAALARPPPAPAVPGRVAGDRAIGHSQWTDLRHQSRGRDRSCVEHRDRSRTIRSICCWARPAAAFGKVPTRARPGSPHRSDAVARDRRHRFRPQQLRRKSMPEAAKATSTTTSAPAFTNPPTAARRGVSWPRRRSWALAFTIWSSIRRIRRFFMPRRPTDFTNRPIAADLEPEARRDVLGHQRPSERRVGRRCWPRSPTAFSCRPTPAIRLRAVALPSAPTSCVGATGRRSRDDGARRCLCVRRRRRGSAYLWRRDGNDLDEGSHRARR